MCNGSSGWAARCSIKTNDTNSTTLTTSAMIVIVAPQELVSALEKP